jgi:hypothetical protein
MRGDRTFSEKFWRTRRKWIRWVLNLINELPILGFSHWTGIGGRRGIGGIRFGGHLGGTGSLHAIKKGGLMRTRG